MRNVKLCLLSSALLLTMVGLSSCRTIVASTIGFFGGNSVEERTLGEAIDDKTIYGEITHYFVQADVNDLLPNVTVRVREGRVLLTGTVKQQATAREAVRLSWIARGVKEVINNIQVSDKSTIIDDANDTWIETQVETRIFAEKNVRSFNYTVEVENSIVYLLGVAQSEQELKKVAYIAGTTKGVKKVISYVRLKTHPSVTER